MIIDGALMRDRSGAADLRSYLLLCYPKAEIPPLAHVVRTADPMAARVNHSIWIASCDCGARGLPRPGCIVDLDLLLGFCVRCGNRARGGGWRPVVAPAAETRARIEAVLLLRPDPETRNWEPHESVDDLVAENREHGCPAPEAA